MNDEQLLRYSRHILLDEIGIEGQAKILAAHALLIGAGGLGSPAAMYLASAGIGRITLADGDTVDLTNLQRQILHTQDRIGQAKALLSGRDYVVPEDLKAFAHEVLRHRIMLTFEALADGVVSDQIVDKIVETVPVP